MRAIMTNAYLSTPNDQPQLFFFCELNGDTLARLLELPRMLHMLAERRYGVALALPRLDDTYADAVRRLNRHQIAVIAWLALPDSDGMTFNLQNYPRAVACYQTFHLWAQANQLQFAAVGLEMEPPIGDALLGGWHGVRELARRVWLARDNALFPAARASYSDLIAAMRRDGYEVHAYQAPLIADDRRVGTTLLQRALDIIDLPADVEVLMCLSDDAPKWFGSALIANYGSAADAIAVGISGDAGATIEWHDLRRDLLLAATNTDMIYVATLEGCVAAGHLERIAALDWHMPARVPWLQSITLNGARLLVLTGLLIARYGITALAWSGWALALLIWLRGRRKKDAG